MCALSLGCLSAKLFINFRADLAFVVLIMFVREVARDKTDFVASNKLLKPLKHIRYLLVDIFRLKYTYISVQIICSLTVS